MKRTFGQKSRCCGWVEPIQLSKGKKIEVENLPSIVIIRDVHSLRVQKRLAKGIGSVVNSGRIRKVLHPCCRIISKKVDKIMRAFDGCGERRRMIGIISVRRKGVDGGSKRRGFQVG